MNISSISTTTAAAATIPRPTTPGAIPVGDATLQRLTSPPQALTQQSQPLELLHGDLMLEYVKANATSASPYAQVVKDGKVVATLNNDGSAVTTNADAGLFDIDGGPSQGPDLAQWRADQIAHAVGGEVRLADTAQAQADWKPPTLSREGFAAYLARRFPDPMASAAGNQARPTPGLLRTA